LTTVKICSEPRPPSISSHPSERRRILRVAGTALGVVLSLLPAAFQAQELPSASGETTEPSPARFPLLPAAGLPESTAVPSPRAFLGRPAGADGPIGAADLARYLRALDEASARVTAVPLGNSDEGREIVGIAVSDEENLAALERYRSIGSRLADPRATTAAEVEGLAAEGKLVYLLWSGARAADVAAPEALAGVAFRLAVSEQPEIQALRRDAVVVVVPVLDPDARERALLWYQKNLQGRKVAPGDPLATPPAWGAYAADDADQDGLRGMLAGSRALAGAFFSFLPQVVHELRDGSEPWVTLRGAPSGPTAGVDRGAAAELSGLADAERARLTAVGVPAVRVSADWDAWWPGTLGGVAALHNALTRRTEIFAAPSGAPLRVEADGATVTWTAEDSVRLGEAAALAALIPAAAHKLELLSGLWGRARRAVEAGRSAPPYAYLLPGEGEDPARRGALLDGLASQHVEGGRLAADATLGGRPFRAGAVVIRLDQPYGAAARLLLGEQAWPGGGPRPAAAGWSWPAIFGIEAQAIDDPRILEVPLTFGGEPAAKGVTGAGGSGDDLFLLRDSGQVGLLRARVLLGSYQVDAADRPFQAAGAAYSAGSWIVQAPRAAVEAVAAKTGLSFEAAATLPEVGRHIVDLPRLGLYVPWSDTRGAGWVRLALDAAGIPYAVVTDADLKAGELGRRFDLLILPDARGGWVRQLHGLDPGVLPWTSVGGGGAPAGLEVTGGFGLAGLASLDCFVRDGGVLLTMGNGALVPLAAGLLRGADGPSAASPAWLGSEVAAAVARLESPLAYGYGARTSLFIAGGPWIDTAQLDPRWTVVRFGPGKRTAEARAEPAPEDPSAIEVEDIEAREEVKPAAVSTAAPEDLRAVRTGAAVDGETAGSRPALLDVPVGRGRVVALAFDPFARALPLSDLRFAYNALLYWNDLPGVEP
jgi:hypothetical protein